MIALETLSLRSTQARATSAGLWPASRASLQNCWTGTRTSSRSSHEMKCFEPSSVARVPLGTGSPGAYLPVRTPWASGDQTIWPMPSTLDVGITSASGTRQSSEYCGWLETIRSRPICSAISTAVGDLGGRPLRHADVVDLAGPHEVVEGPQGLFERRLHVVAVRLEQVEVVGAEPLQRALARLDDVLAREPPVVRVRTGRPEDLGEDLDRVAPHPAERLAEDALGLAHRGRRRPCRTS